MKQIVIMGIIMGLFGCSSGTKEEAFWKWFKKNSDRLLETKNEMGPITDELTYELKKVNPDLVYEMSAIKHGQKTEFTISADGNNEVINAVLKLYEKRPDLEDWEIKAFRQRNNQIINLEMNDIRINGSETKYLIVKAEEPDKINILLFFPNFEEDKRETFGGAAYIFLDGLLGEYDVMTKVGFVEVFGKESQYFKDSHSIDELVNEFDLYFKK